MASGQRQKIGNKHKALRSSAHKSYYAEQFQRTAMNKARRMRQRTHRQSRALTEAMARYDKNLLICRHVNLHPRPQ